MRVNVRRGVSFRWRVAAAALVFPLIGVLPSLPVDISYVYADGRPGRAPKDLASKQRIQQIVPSLLSPCQSIEHITVVRFGPNRVQLGQRKTISDAKTIGLICDTLRSTIIQGKFQIGSQFFTPASVDEIVFVRQGEPALQLQSVGSARFWMLWHIPTKEPQSEWINFHSPQFSAFTAEFLRIPDSQIASDFSLRVSRRGCEGKCPMYSVDLDARGLVTWTGQRNVATKGSTSARIDLTQVHSIVQKIKSQQLLSFQKTNLLCVDTPSITILLTLEGRSVSLISDECAWKQTREGREMSEFIDFAETVMGVNRWIN